MKNKISEKQFFSLTASFFMGNSLALAGGLSRNEKIGYITLFVSYLLFIGLCFIYSRIFKKHETSDLFEITEKLFGDFSKKIILGVVLIYSLFTAFISSLEFLFFIELSSDFSVKSFFIALLFSICILSILLCGKKALARYSELILPFVVFSIAVILFIGLDKINISNLKIDKTPEAGFVFSNIFMNFLTPFSNILLVYFFASDLFNQKQIKKASLKAGFVALIVISSIYLMNLLIIGKKLMGSLYFPTLYTFSVINPELFTERSETVFFITYMFFDILYTAVALFTAVDCAEKLFCKKNTLSPKRKKVFYTIVSFLCFIILNIKFDINAFYSSFTVIPFLISVITLGLPLFFTTASYFKKSNRSQPLNSSDHHL